MSLEDIIYSSGIKRKAIAVVRTRCRYCFKDWLDKYYMEHKHRVLCPWCHKENAVVEFDDLLQVMVMGLRYDIGTMGIYGFHLTSQRRIMKLLKKAYGDDAQNKFDELMKNLDMTQGDFKKWLKMRKLVNQKPK